jgi:CHASE2 domain-containing sensor protein
MSKLVVLKLYGDLALGVQAILEIREQDKCLSTDITGYLPPSGDIIAGIDQWQSTYRSLGNFTRIKAKRIFYDGSISKRCEECHHLASSLRWRLNNWLLSESFRPIREKLLKHLTPSEEVRILIRTPCLQLKKLPWHLWDLIEEDYTQAEVTLSVADSEKLSVAQPFAHRNQVRILAIFGDSQGIDVKRDRYLLENLPYATTTFLEKPQRKDINEYLWNQPLDILFFAGHSLSFGETGRIFINETDSLTIDELRYSLKNAVANGLQLAIFNSCDGLGLAQELQQVQIPQIIVMREPVPDQVAQEFLKHFLLAFSSGKSLYMAVRTARERLQGLENEYPFASWLPVICEHPTIAPIVWPKPQVFPNTRRWLTMLLLCALSTTGVLGIRYTGALQPWELRSYDTLMRLRPQSTQDSRLLVIAITEDDFQLPEQQDRIGSLSDSALLKLVEKLTQLGARTIGLDIYHDFPMIPTLASRLQKVENFFAICKASDSTINHPGTSPPSEIPLTQVGFSDIVVDADNVLRRHLLAINPPPASPCTTPYAFSAQLAFHYLEQDGISAQYTPQGELQLGDVLFQRLHSHMGGYQKVDTLGYQILLNYRSYRGSPLEMAPTLTLTDILRGRVKPEQVKDRIVIIGVTAQSVHDYMSTPYSIQQGFYEEMPGVIVQAQMVSQIVSAVKDGRPLISVLPVWGDILWVWASAMVGGVIAWRCRKGLYLIVIELSALLVLYIQSLVLFNQGIWIPLIPCALVLIIAGASVFFYIRIKP